MNNVHKIRYIQAGDLRIAASCEATVDNMLEVYYPDSVLLYVQMGTLHIVFEDKEHIVPRGHFAILRKYSLVKLFKSWSKEEGMAKTYGFGLKNDFIKKVIHKISMPKRMGKIAERVVHVPKTEPLENLMNYLIAHIDEDREITEEEIESKTLQALRGIAKGDQNLLCVFYEYSNKELANIEKLMEHNFLLNVPLPSLAEISGRSLSTFHRDFKKIFNDTPKRWVTKQRLHYAQQLMETKALRPSQVYLESGFEDLSHFSRAFKKRFKLTPSEFYEMISKN